MGFNNIYHPIIGVVKRRTEKAILFVVTDPEALTDEDAEIENWIPKSQVSSITPLTPGSAECEVRMSEWIIGQKDLKRFIRPALTSSQPSAKVTPTHPPVPSTPPVNHWADMDDDIPF